MGNTFDNWHGNAQELAHHGIRGMKWGVRRYQNEDGSLTALGETRYGVHGGGTSARRSQRDLNNLDRGYAQLAANREQASRDTNKYANKILKRTAKKVGYNTENTRSFMEKDRKIQKWGQKAKENTQAYQKYDKQMKAAESLQMRIIGHAAQKGYTVNSKAVKRAAYSGKEQAKVFLAYYGGGIAAGSIAAARSHPTITDGQKFKVSKKGDGSTKLVNYAEMNRQERERQRR